MLFCLPGRPSRCCDGMSGRSPALWPILFPKRMHRTLCILTPLSITYKASPIKTLQIKFPLPGNVIWLAEVHPQRGNIIWGVYLSLAEISDTQVSQPIVE